MHLIESDAHLRSSNLNIRPVYSVFVMARMFLHDTGFRKSVYYKLSFAIHFCQEAWQRHQACCCVTAIFDSSDYLENHRCFAAIGLKIATVA